MTTLCAYATSEAIYLGSDQQVCCGDQIDPEERPKWWRTYSRPLQALGWAGPMAFEPLAIEVYAELCRHESGLESPSAGAYAEALRQMLTARGWAAESNGGGMPERRLGVLAVWGHQLYQLDVDLGVALPVPDHCFEAMGSGRSLARGAWAALHRPGVDLPHCMCQALRVACTLDLYSGGDPWLYKIARTPV